MEPSLCSVTIKSDVVVRFEISIVDPSLGRIEARSKRDRSETTLRDVDDVVRIILLERNILARAYSRSAFSPTERFTRMFGQRLP